MLVLVRLQASVTERKEVMEKKFALIALGVMCLVFIFIFANNTGGTVPGAVPIAGASTNAEANATAEANTNQAAATTNSEEVVQTVGDLPIVTITMEDGGTIKLELYPEIAPNTVNNFIYLANQGF